MAKYWEDCPPYWNRISCDLFCLLLLFISLNVCLIRRLGHSTLECIITSTSHLWATNNEVRRQWVCENTYRQIPHFWMSLFPYFYKSMVRPCHIGSKPTITEVFMYEWFWSGVFGETSDVMVGLGQKSASRVSQLACRKNKGVTSHNGRNTARS